MRLAREQIVSNGEEAEVIESFVTEGQARLREYQDALGASDCELRGKKHSRCGEWPGTFARNECASWPRWPSTPAPLATATRPQR